MLVLFHRTSYVLVSDTSTLHAIAEMAEQRAVWSTLTHLFDMILRENLADNLQGQLSRLLGSDQISDNAVGMFLLANISQNCHSIQTCRKNRGNFHEFFMVTGVSM